MHSVLVKIVVTPVLIGGASLAGRRWGHQVGGWLIALPLTSGPVAFFLATEHGTGFAGHAAVGMLAATASQLAFALAYRALAHRGIPAAFAAGCVAFATSTTVLAFLNWPVTPTFLLVLAALAAGFAITHHSARSGEPVEAADPPGWDVPLRMIMATGVVMGITGLAPVIGAHLAGLLSPFPVFGFVMAAFTQCSDGAAGAVAVLDGMIAGLAAPAVFFLVLALALRSFGLAAFAVAAVAALATQAGTVFAIPADGAGSTVAATPR